jgi:hypothetical protein
LSVSSVFIDQDSDESYREVIDNLRGCVGWILGYHSALTQPLQLGRGGEPTPPTCAYIYHSVDLLYSAIESSFSTDSHESGLRSVYSESAVAR